jgi:hypothetical protein
MRMVENFEAISHSFLVMGIVCKNGTFLYEVRVKLSLCLITQHTMKMHGGSRSISPLNGSEWSASRPGCFMTMGQIPVSVDTKLGGPQSWSGCGREKVYLPLLGI